MSKLLLNLPDAFPFRTEIDVRITDVNYGQHVGHDSMLSILHEARMRFLQTFGASETDVGGCGLIMTDTAIQFNAEVTYPSRLVCEVAFADPSRSAFDLYYCVTRAADGVRVAAAKTGMLCFDYTRRRPARMPSAFRAHFPVPADGTASGSDHA